MVRNEGGGNKMKHLARKHVNGSSQQQANKFLRVSQCKEEVYAYVLRILGNSMCMVKCVDGYERLCHIRGKFTGRSKRENVLSQGTWVLVGLRQWDSEKEFAVKASKKEKNIQKCDLLEIYSTSEREKLRVQEKIFQDVIADEGSDSSNPRDDEFSTNHTVEFKDQMTLDYQEIIAQGGKLSKLKTSSYQSIYEDISDTDDDDDYDDDRETSTLNSTTMTIAIGQRQRQHDTSQQRDEMQLSGERDIQHPSNYYEQQMEEVDIDDI